MVILEVTKAATVVAIRAATVVARMASVVETKEATAKVASIVQVVVS